jgi:muramidase (phage lysozyme)
MAVVESTHPALAAADPLSVVEQCESGGNPTAHNPNSTAAGAWQILTSTWRAYGGQRYAPTADQAPITEQRQIAERIYAADGLAPWRPSQAC